MILNVFRLTLSISFILTLHSATVPPDQRSGVATQSVSELDPTSITIKRRKGSGYIDIDQMSDYKAHKMLSAFPGDIDITFTLGNLPLDSLGQANFEHRIPRLGTGWIAHTERTFTIDNLPYGMNSMQLRYLLPNGEWSSEVTINIKSTKPFFFNWWFKALLVVIPLSVIWLFIRFRLRHLRRSKRELTKEVKEKTASLQAQARSLERQTEELKELGDAKSQFFANISHEFRTPLTLILGPLHELLKANDLDEQKMTELRRMYRNGRHLLNLTEEVLLLSKLETSKLDLKVSPVNLVEFLRRITSSFESYALAKGIVYEVEIEVDEGLVIQLDLKKAEKIFNNLLSNALKFTDRNGVVNFRAGGSESLEVTVSDTGKGISKEHLPYVFDRFYQGPANSMRELQGGTGIGLALVQELTVLMGGSISAESELSKGSAFKLNIPLVSTSEEPILFEPDSVSLSTATDVRTFNSPDQKPSILIVEDNDDMTAYISGLLKSDYEVIHAGNGLDALEKLREVLPDLIISDVMMPEMDGFTFLEKLRAADQFAAIPVIMLTARAEQDDKLKALTIGVDDYLTKPFVSEELLVRVKNLIINSQNRLSEEQRNNSITPDIEQNLNSQIDINWMKKVEESAAARISNNDFSVDSLAEEMELSTRQFQRKIKQITGLTTTQYLQELRLQLARQGLERQSFRTVQEAALSVGLQSTKYFSKLFKARFGKLPSELLA